MSVNIFDFTTYDGEIDIFFAKKAIEVCEAITNKTTFEYIRDKENYKWYLALCNMPFFQEKIDWGSSIRGAWWGIYGDDTFKISSCGLWKNGEQVLDLELNEQQWFLFIGSMVKFAAIK